MSLHSNVGIFFINYFVVLYIYVGNKNFHIKKIKTDRTIFLIYTPYGTI